jgi:uncharacterized protein YggE
MKPTVVAAPLVVVAVVGAFLVGGGRTTTRVAVAADTPTSTNGIVVDGLGKVSGTPDVLRATLGVSVRRNDVSTALRDANALQSSVRAALRRDGVAAKDLQTSEVSIYPSFDNKGNRDGYSVNETLTAKLRNLDKAGRAISDAVTAGGSSATLQGVTFALEDNVALLGQARDAAYAEAKAKAQRYADLSGRALGQVQLVTETTSPPQELYQYGRAASAAKDAQSAVPVDPGTSQVSVSVTVRWALQ